MKNNRIIALALMLVMLFSLCACGKGKAPSADVSDADISGGDVSAADATSATDADSSDWRLALSADELAVAQVIVSSTDAFNAEDIDAYMATVDPDSAVYASTKESAELVFARYQLHAEIDALTVDSIADGTATVSVTQTTTQVEEGKYAFSPVQVELTHTLTLRSERWYVTSTIVESRRELVDYWGLFIDFAHSDVVSLSDVSGGDTGYADEDSTLD